MALPSNDHHVHSDGYFSEQGDADDERMVEELADNLSQLPIVQSVYPDTDMVGPYVEVEYSGSEMAHMEIEDEVFEWGCHTEVISDRVIEVRPR